MPVHLLLVTVQNLYSIKALVKVNYIGSIDKLKKKVM